jgi:DNA polymerase III sliding clamp (beta) subunit (PCNA family)
MKNMLPVGTVDIGAVNSKNKRTVVKATMDSFPTGNFNSQAFPELSELDVVFTGKASCMRQPYSDVSFSTNPDDPNEVFNKLAIFMGKEDVYFLGADGRRCALYKSPAAKFDTYACLDEQLPLLIETEYLTPVLASLSDDEPLALAVERDCGHVYVISGNTSYRIAMVGTQSRTNYPAVRKIIDMKVGATILIDRQELLLASNVLYSVSNDRGSHSYRENEVILSAQSLMAIKKAEGRVPYAWTSETKLKRSDVCFHTGYLIEGLNRMDCEKAKLLFTPDERKVRIEDETDPQFTYYIQVIPPAAANLNETK